MKENDIKKHFISMARLQKQLNDVIDKDWLYNRTLLDFRIAIFQEVSEFIDTYPWKWWKYMEDDPINRKVELIDIFHFIISYVLLKIFKSTNLKDDLCNAAGIYLYNTYSIALKAKDEKIIEEIIFFNNMIEDNPYIAISVFFKIVKNIFNDNIEDFIKLYYAKNALNIIRQEYGYKEGEYQKIKDNIEDNYHMMKLIEEIKNFDSFEDFKDKLIIKLGLKGNSNGNKH